MQSTNTFSSTFEERMNILDATNRYKVDIQWTQQVFQPIKEVYSPSEQIRVILQRSNHVIDPSEIGISFRPVIQFNQDSLPDVSRKSFMCITPTRASDFFQLSSLTTNGNSLLAQSGVANSNPRNLIMNLYNSLQPIKGHKIGAEESISGFTFPGSSQNVLVGCEENSINHPYQAIATYTAANDQWTAATNASYHSYTDGDQFARAIISKAYTYNFEHNIPNSTFPAQPGNAYFAAYYDNSVNVPIQNGFSGYTPIAQGNTGGDTVGYTTNFPCMPLMVTPSIAQYKQCNERFQSLRMRFITATTSAYSFSGSNALTPATLSRYTMSVTANTKTDIAQAAPTNSGVTPQRMCYGSTIQGVYNTGSSMLNGPNTVQRQLGVTPTAANCTYYPSEQYTNLMCYLSELSMELTEIGPMDFSNTQLVAILQLNSPEQVLSAYLQSGCMFMDKVAAVQGAYTYANPPAALAVNASLGPTSAECYQFLQSCLLGSATYRITDLVARIPYRTYPLETQGIVREICYAPRPFRSIRVQSDVINNPTSIQTQRISIGGSAIVLGAITFIKPVFPQASPNTVLRPQDTMVDYQGCNVPSIGDARYVAQCDSCYLPFTQFSLQVDNNIYESNPLIPISSQQYASYLKSMEGIPLIFDGKQVPLSLRDFVTNRYFMSIAINPRALQQAAIVDQQIIVSASFDASSRIQYAQAMGTARQDCNGCFQMCTYVITMQSLVNDDYVKI